ncbi:MAG TPA: hypothetical protein VH281_05545 [Gaiellaceae bacterium]|jgi:hypothetical protein
MALTPVAFYSIADERHFLGLVALLNSLRLQGHEEPLRVADCGLADWQRDLLAPHVELEVVDGGRPAYLLKLEVARRRPAETIALLDADLIVLRRLDDLLGEGPAVVAFADPVEHRFHPELAGLLDLPPLQRRPYVNSGLLVLGGDRGRVVLELVAQKQEGVELEGIRERGGRPENPFYYADQDVWNAVLASSVEESELRVEPAELAPHPPFPGLRSVAGNGLRFAYDDGQEPYVLHHVDRKPWLFSTRSNTYSRLLPRLLLGEDVALSLDADRVPRRFRSGIGAALARGGAEAGALAHGMRGRVGLRRRLAERSARA